MIIAVWVVALLLLGLWSLAAWGLYSLVSTDAAWVADLGAFIGRIPYAAIIEVWLPGWQGLLIAAAELARAALGWVGGAAPVVVWGLWALGAAALVGTALAITLLAVLLRKASSPPAARPVA